MNEKSKTDLVEGPVQYVKTDSRVIRLARVDLPEKHTHRRKSMSEK
jgi:hypothetical protein